MAVCPAKYDDDDDDDDDNTQIIHSVAIVITAQIRVSE